MNSVEEINDLIKPKLPSKLSNEQLDNKVRSLLRTLRQEEKIINIGTDKNIVPIPPKIANPSSSTIVAISGFCG